MSESYPQAGILLPNPSLCRWVDFTLGGDTTREQAAAALQALLDSNARVDGTFCVVGLGLSLTKLLEIEVPGLRTFPVLAAANIEVPSTPRALWIWLRGDDRGELVHRCRNILQILKPAFVVESIIDGFVHDHGKDLSGYEDGTENPKADAAVRAAIVAEGDTNAPLNSSFVAVQLWQHDFVRFEKLSKEQQDDAIGRERISNEEMEDAPESSHVKRTAQESFDPEAFVVRRSMPWADGPRAGLNLVAFGNTLDSFEVQLRRMAGLEDGIVDGLFGFTQPTSGAYYWCPPVLGGKISLGSGL